MSSFRGRWPRSRCGITSAWTAAAHEGGIPEEAEYAQALKLLRTVGPYLTALGVIALVAVLLAAIYFTQLDLQWIAFLAGILVAAILAMVSRASRAEWVIARRTVGD